jgi:yecA family protein
MFPSYRDVAEALTTLSALGSAEQNHGLLCALMSTHVRITREAWVDSLLSGHIEPGDERGREAYQLLHQLFNATKDAFQSEDFSLPLLLPNDDTPLDERVEALAAFCQGYLTGIHLLGMDVEKNSNARVQECFQDLLAISQAQLTQAEQKDQYNEAYFLDIIEHVRIAVLTIMEELRMLSKQYNHAVC